MSRGVGEITMKTNKLLILGLITCGLVISSCGASKPTEDSKSEAPVSESALPSEAQVPSSSEEITPSSETPVPSSETPISSSEASSSSEGIPDSAYLTVSQAYDLALEVGDAGTSEKQYVRGIVKNITNANYGEMYITDGSKELYIYGVYSANGARKYPELEEKPYKGDEVFLYGIVKTYNGSPEMGASWLQKFISHQGEENLDDYTSMNILAARNAAKESKVLVQGVVANITYANGRVPSGVYLVDDTSSIYVYGPDVAGRVEVGEEIQVAGTRDDYILSTEISYAQQWGYQGSIQLADALFVKSIGKNKEVLKSWIEESTMKELMETPFTNNITTKIFKVNAIVNKDPREGFTNYYINDLDNKTGSYVYTLCNGGDFTHLDKFDGKICTVYLALHNAKATASGAYYRLMPIDVKLNDSFSMSNDDIAKFAVNYYVSKQFKNEYNADPELELLTAVSNTYIPFENVAITYSSTSEGVTFDNVDGKLIMHLGEANGGVTVKVTANYNGSIFTKDITFNVIIIEIPDTIPVSDAISEPDDTEVIVKGVVMSSLINQTGFYLNDGTGVIAIRTDSETIKNINMGNEVVIKGKKVHFKSAANNLGQNCIDGATLVANLMGNHEYSKDPFITDKTFDQIFEYKNTVATDDYTCTVFVTQCYLRKNAGGYSTNYYLSNQDHTKEICLYAGSGSQYSAYEAFGTGSILLTVEFALCNWNTKSEYRACIISASDGETTILNNYNFR